MISEENLVKEFTTVVDRSYPKIGELLHHCYIKIINSYWGRPPRHLQYIGVYCSEEMFACVQVQKGALRKLARNMGLAELVCLNATRLLHDPMSKLKEVEPRLWLELHWIATEEKL